MVEVQSGQFERERENVCVCVCACVCICVCSVLAAIEVRSAKTEVCDCNKKIGVNKSAIITKKQGHINKSAKLQGA